MVEYIGADNTLWIDIKKKKMRTKEMQNVLLYT